MECSGITGVYKRRKPKETFLWKLLNGHFIEFEEVYDELFQKKYGFYRPVISHVVRKYLECGDLHQGFGVLSLAYLLELNAPIAITNIFWPLAVVAAGSVQVVITKKWSSSTTTSRKPFSILFPIVNTFFPSPKYYVGFFSTTANCWASLASVLQRV